MALRRINLRRLTPAGCLAPIVCISALLLAPPAEAAIFRGIQEVIAGVLQVPLSTLAGTFNGPPIIGTLWGATSGLVQGVGLVAHGVLELAASGFEIAKMAAPYVLPFVF